MMTVQIPEISLIWPIAAVVLMLPGLWIIARYKPTFSNSQQSLDAV
jgi:hypothetical protein